MYVKQLTELPPKSSRELVRLSKLHYLYPCQIDHHALNTLIERGLVELTSKVAPGGTLTAHAIYQLTLHGAGVVAGESFFYRLHKDAFERPPVQLKLPMFNELVA